MSRETMANYWIQKGFNSEAVAIFYFEDKRTPEITKMINNCRNTEEALLKITKELEKQAELSEVHSVINILKQGNRIICYVRRDGNIYSACTGKPSDETCISWQYKTRAEAEKTAREFFNNYTNRSF